MKSVVKYMTGDLLVCDGEFQANRGRSSVRSGLSPLLYSFKLEELEELALTVPDICSFGFFEMSKDILMTVARMNDGTVVGFLKMPKGFKLNYIGYQIESSDDKYSSVAMIRLSHYFKDIMSKPLITIMDVPYIWELRKQAKENPKELLLSGAV